MNPINSLLDDVLGKLNLKNDAALAQKLDVSPPVISKLRHGKLPLGPSLVIKIHEVTNMPVRDIKEKAGIPTLPVLA